jgi:hypothetical protein
VDLRKKLNAGDFTAAEQVAIPAKFWMETLFGFSKGGIEA